MTQLLKSSFESGTLEGDGWTNSTVPIFLPTVTNVGAHHGTYCIKPRNIESCAHDYANVSHTVFYGTQIKFDAFHVNTNWVQDYCNVRVGIGTLLGFWGVRSPDGGANWYYTLCWFDMGAYSYNWFDTTVPATIGVYHWVVLKCETTALQDILTLYVDGGVVQTTTQNSSVGFQNLVPTRIVLGGQKTGGFDSYSYIDCVVVDTAYPTDPYEDVSPIAPVNPPIIHAHCGSAGWGKHTTKHSESWMDVRLSNGVLRHSVKVPA